MSTSWRDNIQSLQIDVTSYCNAKCGGCARNPNGNETLWTIYYARTKGVRFVIYKGSITPVSNIYNCGVVLLWRLCRSTSFITKLWVGKY